MGDRTFETIGNRQVNCDAVCAVGGKPAEFGQWSSRLSELGVLANDQGDQQYVVFCSAPNAPKQDDGTTPRLCVPLNKRTKIEEL